LPRPGTRRLGSSAAGADDPTARRPRRHAELIAIPHDDARLVLDRDPHLKSARGQALRTLLYLFRATMPFNTCAPADFP
jgi:ATP-dependent DNA helicase RecG